MSVTEIRHVLCSGLKVKVYNLTQYEHGADDVLVMGTDGLWDVLSNQEVAEAVTTFLANCDPDDLHRSAAFFSSFIFLLLSVCKPEGWWCFQSELLHPNVKLFRCKFYHCVAHFVEQTVFLFQ